MANEVTKKENTAVSLYGNSVNIGTEEMNQEDINTPFLKIVQPTTQDIDEPILGAYYRTDTKQQEKEVLVNLVYVSTIEAENYNKTAKEKVKIYFGFYVGTNEPFKMYLRGWGLASHRNFQTEVMSIKNRFKAPMLSLTIKLTTEKQTGTIQDTGKPYTIYKPVFNIAKDEKGQPSIEQDSKRVSFLVQAANKFKEIALVSDNDESQNEIPNKEEKINPEDIPF